MNNRITLTALVLMLALSARAQSVPDTTGTQALTRSRTAHPDKDGDGMPNRRADGHGRRSGRMDRFIDVDGDGICDGRENGLGFRRGRSGNSIHAGTKGRGK